MESPYKDSHSSLPPDMPTPQGPLSAIVAGEDTSGKLEGGITQMITTEAWNINSSGILRKPLTPLSGTASMASPAVDPPGGVALKVAATVLQPICLGESPVVLPIHLQMAGSAASQHSQGAGAGGSYLMTSQGPVSLPIVLEQQVFQQLNSPMLQTVGGCPGVSLQSNLLCQNASLSIPQPPPLDQKPTGTAQDTGLQPFLQNPSLAALLQDLFPGHNNPNLSSCHIGSSTPTDHFSAFLPPPPLMHSYSSPLSPLVPPATLLVPYPIIVPLPVPLPIPIPIPIPSSTESKAFADLPKPVCTVSKSTQTNTKETLNPLQQNTCKGQSLYIRSMASPSNLVCQEEEVLDLSVGRVPPIQPKQEVPLQPESVLDLSVARVRKSCIQSFVSRDAPPLDRDRICHPIDETSSTTLSLDVLRPMECQPKLDSRILNGLASLEFSRQHKWVVDGSGGTGGSGGTRPGYEPKCGAGGNFEIVSTSQTAKVIVSVKDAMPAIFCGKLKGLSGVSTKNFSIKRDANQDTMLQQCLGAKAQTEQRPCDTLKKNSKNRAIKLKKVNSQEIHILPIKKQRLAAFFPRK